MKIYAQLNNENICIGVTRLADEKNDPQLVPVPIYSEDYLWRKFEEGAWSEEKHIPGKAIVRQSELEALLLAIQEKSIAIQELSGLVDTLILDALQEA